MRSAVVAVVPLGAGARGRLPAALPGGIRTRVSHPTVRATPWPGLFESVTVTIMMHRGTQAVFDQNGHQGQCRHHCSEARAHEGMIGIGWREVKAESRSHSAGRRRIRRPAFATGRT
jgi:hypothetical protein